ncbi:MAG TPA: efflux RND transporter periplasmic adaptor subunit [Gemmatimonadales bacterium]|nr:efflux RND transporter periplasmic adaptor subunit [Gemmatimonadales bacterium]
MPSRRAATARRVNWVIGAVVVLAIGAGIARALRPNPVPVEVAEVARGPLRVTVDEDGMTRVKDRFVVSAPLAGMLTRIELHPGDSVERGTAVARLLPAVSPMLDPRSRSAAEARVAAAQAALRQAETAVRRARAAADFAGREAERQRKLFAAGATAAQTLEAAELAERMRDEERASAEFGLRVAESELRVARAALRRLDADVPAGEQFVVPAPVDGRVLRVLQESETVVAAGAPLLEIGDAAALEIVVDVLTTDAVDIRPGALALIEGWGGGDTLRGHVHRVEPAAFTRVSSLGVEEQRVNVLIDLEDRRERWGGLGDGYRVEARIVVWEAADVLQVPAGAVFRQGDGWAVYAVEGGRARLRPVEIGRRTAAAAQVLKGVEAGEPVVVYPSDNVRDGVRVTG